MGASRVDPQVRLHGAGGGEEPLPARRQRPAVVAVEAKGEAEGIVDRQRLPVLESGDRERGEPPLARRPLRATAQRGRTADEGAVALGFEDAVRHQPRHRAAGRLGEDGPHVGRQRARLAQGQDEEGGLAVDRLDGQPRQYSCRAFARAQHAVEVGIVRQPREGAALLGRQAVPQHELVRGIGAEGAPEEVLHARGRRLEGRLARQPLAELGPQEGERFSGRLARRLMGGRHRVLGAGLAVRRDGVLDAWVLRILFALFSQGVLRTARPQAPGGVGENLRRKLFGFESHLSPPGGKPRFSHISEDLVC